MNDTASRDIELVRQLVPQCYASRHWAEELLCRAFGLANASEILSDRNNRSRIIPGTSWRVRVHGIGVDVAEAACGGIGFDSIFAEKQLNAGNLPAAD